VAIVYSSELINCIIRVVEEGKNNRHGLDHESVIFFPDEYEVLETFKNAVNQRSHEPFTFLEKRVIQYIRLEKLVEE